MYCMIQRIKLITLSTFIEMPVPITESGQLCTSVLEIFRLDVRTVPTVYYSLLFCFSFNYTIKVTK